MMVFVIPVRSKAITKDWTGFSNLVNRCIGSICNQTSTNYKVLVACHEIPETKFSNDSRVEFIQVEFEPPILNNKPEDRWLKEADKGKKIKFAAEHAQKLGASYIMTVDSDDCISNKICDFVSENEADSEAGWYVKKGYLYPEGKRYSYLNTKNFHTVCGSCVIIKPELIDFMYGENYWFNHERTSFSNGISLKALPFPGALYSMLNGTNIRLNSNEMKKRTKFNAFELNSIKTLLRRLAKYRIVPNKFITEEFSIYKV